MGQMVSVYDCYKNSCLMFLPLTPSGSLDWASRLNNSESFKPRCAIPMGDLNILTQLRYKGLRAEPNLLGSYF